MKYIFSAITFIVVFLVGCAGTEVRYPEHLYVHLDTDFTEEESVHILQAMTEWQMATQDIVKIESVSRQSHAAVVAGYLVNPNAYTDDVYVIRINNKDDFCPNSTYSLQGTTVGLATHNEFNFAECLWAPWADDHNLLHRIALHEFGHVLGLKHVADDFQGQSVMFSHIEQCSENLTCTDINQFCSLHHCNLTCP